MKCLLSLPAAMYDEIRLFREACGEAHMKTILAIGELGTFTNVYKASLVAMMAGESYLRSLNETSNSKCSLSRQFKINVQNRQKKLLVLDCVLKNFSSNAVNVYTRIH